MKHALRALGRDLAAVADHDEKVKAFVGGLNALGYEVTLTRVAKNPNQSRRARPQLNVVGPGKPEGD